MKKLITFSFLVGMVAMTANSGCTKSGGSNPIVAAIPDIANFELQAASAFVAGAASTISILAPSLGSGAFTVNFNLTGANTLSNQTATLTMNGSTGTFQTPALSNSGETNISINSITNSAGGSANVTSNNTYSISDSTGLMTGTYTSGSTKTTLRATHVLASITLSQLNIIGVIWEPNLININVTDYLYSNAPATVNFNFNSNIPSSPTNNSTYNGDASYGFAGASGTISDLSAHGFITITTVSPLLTGNFSYTNEDSSTVVCTFSCPNP
jgi:hypothetical protein